MKKCQRSAQNTEFPRPGRGSGRGFCAAVETSFLFSLRARSSRNTLDFWDGSVQYGVRVNGFFGV